MVDSDEHRFETWLTCAVGALWECERWTIVIRHAFSTPIGALTY